MTQASVLVPSATPPEARLAPGERVEVQNRFDGSWSTGFEIAEVLGPQPRPHYRIRRLSDGAVLPRLFGDAEVGSLRGSTWR